MSSELAEPVLISPLLKRLAYPSTGGAEVSALEIADAFSLIFTKQLSVIQCAALLTLLHSTGRDKDPEVIARCAERMRTAAHLVDLQSLRETVGKKKLKHGLYRGGLCDIVGTGGDSHSTFNISTTSSIIASALLVIAKHGNRAQTSKSGSADVLLHLSPQAPRLSALTAQRIPELYAHTNYVFLFAPNFHPGMANAAHVRAGLGLRTIFNLLGPLANPVDSILEARLVGVAYQELGPVFADALMLSGVTKALVVCGEEDLDEISCAGKTNCWMLKETPDSASPGPSEYRGGDSATVDKHAKTTRTSKIEKFQLQPSDFGLPNHPLTEVFGGKEPKENAERLLNILKNELSVKEASVLDFVLMNTAALLVVSGVCEGDTCATGEVIRERGPGGGRWKEGVRKARWCIESGKALQELEKFIEISNTW